MSVFELSPFTVFEVVIVYYPMRLAPRRVTGGMSDAHQRRISLETSVTPSLATALGIAWRYYLFDLQFFFLSPDRWSTHL